MSKKLCSAVHRVCTCVHEKICHCMVIVDYKNVVCLFKCMSVSMLNTVNSVILHVFVCGVFGFYCTHGLP